MEGALVQFGLALLQPVQPGQSESGHFASAAQGALTSVAARKAAQRAEGERERELTAAETKAGAAKTTAEATAANVKRQGDADRAKEKVEQDKLAAQLRRDKSLSRLQESQRALNLAKAKGEEVGAGATETAAKNWRLQAADVLTETALAQDPTLDENAVRHDMTRLAISEPGADRATWVAQTKADILSGNYFQFGEPAEQERALALVDQIAEANPAWAGQGSPAPAGTEDLPTTYKGKPVSEADITATMQATGMTRDQVLQRIREAGGQ